MRGVAHLHGDIGPHPVDAAHDDGGEQLVLVGEVPYTEVTGNRARLLTRAIVVPS